MQPCYSVGQYGAPCIYNSTAGNCLSGNCNKGTCSGMFEEYFIRLDILYTMN